MSSLEAVYDMTWAEFQIRLFAYKRMDLYRWMQIRELAWSSFVAPHQDPKKMPKTKERFWPLNGDKQKSGGVSDEMKQIFLNEYKKWQQAVS